MNLEGYRQTSNVDEKFCGKLWPPELTSKDPRMILTFDTHNATTARFVASYRFLSGWYTSTNLSRIVRKLDFCLGENKGADQLRGNREADQRLCFRYTDSTISLLLKSEIASF